MDISEQCLCAFRYCQKEDALRLLPKVQQPHQDLVLYAAKHGWHDILQDLIENYYLSSTDKGVIFSRHGPLQIACAYNRAEVVKYLLTFPSVLLTVNDEDDDGMSALDHACYSVCPAAIEMLLTEPSVCMPNKKLYNHRFAILSLLSSKMNWSTELYINLHFPVFMAGNSGAGKTTLTTVMKRLTEYRYSDPVSEVKTLTAGICPTRCSG